MGFPHSEVLPSIEKKVRSALAGVAQWIEHRPANQSVAGLIPSQGRGHVRGNHTLMFSSLSFSLLSPLSKNKINKVFKKKKVLTHVTCLNLENIK